MHMLVTLGARGIKAGVKAKIKGDDTKVAIAKGIHASTGVKVTTIVKAIDLTLEHAPTVIEETKVIVAKAKAKVTK